MKKFSVLTLLLVVGIAALAVGVNRLQSELSRIGKENSWNKRKIALLQVQLMDQLISQEQEQEVDKLLTNPEEWLAPLRAKINADPKLAALLKEVGFSRENSTDQEIVQMCCNPIDDSPEPYELFTLTFSGDQCIQITCHAMRPW